MAKNSISDATRLLPDWFKRATVAMAGGALAGAALPRLSWWPLIFASVYLLHRSIRGAGFWRGAGIGFIGGIFYFASQSIWMSAYLGPEPWLALSILEGLIFAVGLGTAALVWQYLDHAFGERTWGGLATVVVLSAIWISREWVSCHWPYGGYQWSRLGQALASTPFASLAYFGGISLVSLFAVVVAISALVLPKRGRMRLALGALPVVLLLIATLAAPSLIGINSSSSEHRNTLQVTAVQGNANAGLFANPKAGSILAKHIMATKRFFNQHKRLQGESGFTVWPENASDVDPTTNPLASLSIHSLTDQLIKQPLVFGAVTHRGSKTYNSVLVYQPGQADYQIYDKRRPVPFGEYVPDREVWRPLAPDLIDLIWRGFTPGKKAGVFDIAGTRVGTLICFEIGIDELTHDLVTAGSTVILSQANNADFGHTDEAFQQESLARLQAISAGRPIIHVSTVATTEIIAPDGSVLAGPVPAFSAGAVSHPIVPVNALTPAMRFFGWVDGWAAALSLFFISLALIARMRVRWHRKLSDEESSVEA